MKLYIAEKPSLGRAIADVLPKPHRSADGCIYASNGDCVSWCIGHLLEQAEPDAYDPNFKSWKFEHLPIIPNQWQLKPKSSGRKQLAVLRKLVKEADQIIHAGDPDREGQLLVDQVIEHLNVRGTKRDNIQRLLISDLNPKAVTRALGQLKSNKEFVPLSVSALARSRADWLYGINMTRAYTLQGRKVGYNGVLSVGRVQTPLLGLVVARDIDIEAFQSKPFYQVIAHLITAEGETFKAKWQPSEACQPYQDEEGRVLSKALAENVVARISGQEAQVLKLVRSTKKQAAPLPYNLSSLQIDAAKRFGMSAKQVLDTCQALYEKHKLLTYPRSDCRYLPVEHLQQRSSILAAIANNDRGTELERFVENADQSLKSKAWNDSKVSAHHAIIPTEKKFDLNKLSSFERNIYNQVARQYIAQFYPALESLNSECELLISGGHFIAKAKQITVLGWQALFPKAKSNSEPNTFDDKTLNSQLPNLNKGDSLQCQQGELIEKQTTPPKPFDDASLLAAMTGIARYISEPTLKNILKETDGLGTEATRAGIIELLFTRNFLMRQGKQIHATDTGRALIKSLPLQSTTPDMTARWEMQLNAITLRQENYQGFMQPLQQTLTQMIAESQQHLPSGLKNQSGCKSGFNSNRKNSSNSSSKGSKKWSAKTATKKPSAKSKPARKTAS